MASPVKLLRSDYAQRLIHLDGAPISFAAVPFMAEMINCSAEKKIFQTARQIGKSTTSAADIIVDITATPHWRSLYIAPRNEQVMEFSKDKLNSMLNNSPAINQFFVDHSVQKQVKARDFLNGSRIVLRSCYHTADAARGISSNALYIDEIQDIIMDNIPVLEEVTARKEPRKITYAGTPKTFDNPIAKLWDKSTQNYWAIKCTHCNHWNVPLSLENISPAFLCCAKCGGQIHSERGFYVSKYPSNAIVGFHVSQLMIYGAPGTGLPWSRVVDKLNDPLYSISKLYNECLGFSFDVGAKLLTESQLRACCNEDIEELSIDRKASWGITKVAAGVDWGVLGGNTHTVLTIGGLNANDKLQLLFAKKYPVDQDPFEQVSEIADTINRAGVSVVCADRGGGHHANSHLRKALTWAKVHEIEYKPKVLPGMYYNTKSKTWITDRTRALAGVVIDAKTGQLEFPSYATMSAGFFPDLLTLSCEYNDRIRAYQILRNEDVPDDFAHGLCYLRLAAKKIGPRPTQKSHVLEEFMAPAKEGGEDVEEDYADE